MVYHKDIHQLFVVICAALIVVCASYKLELKPKRRTNNQVYNQVHDHIRNVLVNVEQKLRFGLYLLNTTGLITVIEKSTQQITTPASVDEINRLQVYRTPSEKTKAIKWLDYLNIPMGYLQKYSKMAQNLVGSNFDFSRNIPVVPILRSLVMAAGTENSRMHRLPMHASKRNTTNSNNSAIVESTAEVNLPTVRSMIFDLSTIRSETRRDVLDPYEITELNINIAFERTTNYLVEGYVRFFEAVTKKSPKDLHEILDPVPGITKDLLSKGYFKWATENIWTSLRNFSISIEDSVRDNFETLKAKAEVWRINMKNRLNKYDKQANELLDKVNSFVTHEDGEHLNKKLTQFESFPQGEQSGAKLCEELIIAFCTPFEKNKENGLFQLYIAEIDYYYASSSLSGNFESFQYI